MQDLPTLPADEEPFRALIQRPSYVSIVAEIGINHNGNMEVAKELIVGCASAGVDFVKLQKRTITTVYSSDYLESARESPWGTTQRHQKEALEFNHDEYQELMAFAQDLGVGLTASAWDLESLQFVELLNPAFHKVPSALMTHLSFLSAVAELGRPIVASTGMLSPGELDQAVTILTANSSDVILLHTVSVYPCPEDQLNLLQIPVLAETFGLPVGYSGHEPSLSPSILAIGLGACMLERHVTLSRSMYGTDQSASLELRGLRDLVAAARKAPKAMGDGVKRYMDGEREVADKLRYW